LQGNVLKSMKTKFLILIAAIIFSLQISFAQTAKQLSSIRNQVNLINKNVKKYTKTTKNVEGISLEGTEADYFAAGKDLKKITATSYGETYKAMTEIYYSGDNVIFVYRKFSSYDTQIGMNPPPKIVKVTESRFYFENGKMIKFLNGKKDVKNTTKFWLDSESETVQMTEKLKAEY
jgi:hypothetical protein